MDTIEGKETTVAEAPKTPTAEEQLSTLRKEHDDLVKKYEQTEKGLRTAHQTLTEKDKELKKQVDLMSRIGTVEDMIKVLATEKFSVPEDELTETAKTKKADIDKAFQEIEKKRTLERQLAEQEAAKKSYNEQADTIFAKAKEVFKDDDDSLERVELLLKTGDIERARKRVEKVEEKKSTDTKSQESEEVKFQKRLEEEKRKWQEESGLLVSDAGKPAGKGGLTLEQIKKMSKDELAARSKEVKEFFDSR
jgi:chromosome segregation ATPase